MRFLRAAEIFRRRRYRLEQMGSSRSRAACGAGRWSWSAPRITAARSGCCGCAARCGCRASRTFVLRAYAALAGGGADPRRAGAGGDRRARSASRLRRDRLAARRFGRLMHRIIETVARQARLTPAEPVRGSRRSPLRRPDRPTRQLRRPACIGARMIASCCPICGPYRWRVAWALAQVFLIAGFELLKPWPLQIVIDYVLGGKAARSAGLSAICWRAESAARCACLGLVHRHLGAGALTLCTTTRRSASASAWSTTCAARSTRICSACRSPFTAGSRSAT